MRVSDFYFDLPEELIAQHPPAERGSSRMLVVSREQRSGNREQGTGDREQACGAGLTDAMFRDLPEYLRAGDLLVLNDSRVLPARLFATRAGLGTQTNSPQPAGLIEVLLTEEVVGGGEAKTDTGILRFAQKDKSFVWRVLVKPAKKVRVGETLLFLEAGSVWAARTKTPGLKPQRSESAYRGLKPAATPDGGSVIPTALEAEVVEAGEFGERTLRFRPVEDFYGVVARIGHVPLPPYIRREQAKETDSAEDRERYQTVYAHALGSAAAPTAGLHFTPEVLAALAERGVEIAYLTLHVGLGTFQPVRVAELKDIRLHAERYTLPATTADALNRAMAEGRRVVAVGTTTTRTLEHVAAVAGFRADGGKRVPGAKAHPDPVAIMPGLKSRPISEANALEASEVPPRREFHAHSGSTSIFIGPGHRFRIVGGLLTNFHLPESTLLMLVSAFAGERGRETVLAAYAHAVRERYRFYSYGDCMLVV